MIFRKYLCNHRLLKKEFLRTKYIMILHTIMLFLCTSLPAVLVNENAKHYEFGKDERIRSVLEALGGINVFAVFIAAASSFGTVYFLFSYMFSKKSVIFYGSMPEKKSCVFGTKFIAVIISVIIPVLTITAVNVFLTYILSVGSAFFVVKHMLFLMYQYIFLISAFSFAASLAGNFLSMFTVSAFGFLLYPLAELAAVGTIETWFKTYGTVFNPNIYLMFPPALILKSPCEAKYIIFETLLAVIMLCLGIFFCSNRKAENTGKFFSFGFVNPVIKYISSVIGACITGSIAASVYTDSTVISFAIYILFLFLIYIVLRAVFEKSFRAMFSNIKCFMIFAVIYAAVISVPVFDIFGLDVYLPDNVGSVTINATNEISYIAYSKPDYTVTLKNADNINAVLAFARKSTDELKKHKNKYDYDIFSYEQSTMKLGNLPFGIYRKFPYSDSEAIKECVKTVYDSDEFKSALYSAVDSLDDETVYGEPCFNIYASCSYYKTGDFSKDFVKGLKKVLKSDIEKYTYSDISDSSSFASLDSYGNAPFSVVIYNCYEDTVNYLLEHYFFIPVLDSIKIENPKNGKITEISELDEIKNIFRISSDYYDFDDKSKARIYVTYDNESSGMLNPENGLTVVAGVPLEKLPSGVYEKLK